MSGFETFSQLCDVVVTCYRPFQDFSFRGNIPLVPLGGVPLVVRCLAPWVASGFRRFYILHDDEKVLAAIRNSFPKALLGDRPLQLVFVQVSDIITEMEAFRKLAGMREGINKQRDVVITDCTTLLSKEDIIPLITNFYSSMASASLLLWKPSPSDKKEEVNASENLILAGLEEECPGEVVIGASEQPDIAHFRAHYLSDETSAVPQLQIGFVARRPSLEFRYDLNDTGVYVLQPWIFDYIILEEEISFSKSLYGIAHLQHCKINRRPSCEGAAKWPAEILQGLLPEDTAAEVAPPMHWAVASQDFRSADTARFYGASFNSMQSVMPSQWDTFRIAATVVADKADARRRVVRINNAVDLALATADVAVGLHYQVANATMQVAQPRVLCNDFYAMMLATFVDDLKFKRGLAAQSTLKTSIVLLDPKMLGKGTYTDGAYIARTAQVGDKVSLLNCVVMEGAVVGNGCKLKYCVVKPGITVPPNTQELGKVFSE